MQVTLTCAVLEATGKYSAFQRGARSASDVAALAKVMCLIGPDGRTVGDVADVAKLWEGLGKTPMSLNQFLERFDSLLARAQQEKLKPKKMSLDELRAESEKYKKFEAKEPHAK